MSSGYIYVLGSQRYVHVLNLYVIQYYQNLKKYIDIRITWSSLQPNKWEKYADGVALTSCIWLDFTFRFSCHILLRSEFIAMKIQSVTKCMR